MTLEILEVISTEDESVHIRATDNKMPVNIYIERADIDGYLGISDRDAQYKRDFILQNIDVFRMIAYARYQKGIYEEGHSNGVDFLRINLTREDLNSKSLIVPPRRLG